MKRFQWKWIFTGSNTCCTIWRPFCFAMAAILNPKWPPKYKYPPIWAKFGFQVDYDVANWYPLFGSHVMILQIISYLVITSPLLMSGDVLLFYVSFSLLFVLLCHPDCCRVTYCYSTFLFHYYYITPTVVGWCVAILRFFFTIILIILFLPPIFVRSISRRCLDQTLWNLVGISYVMWSCAFKGSFFSKWLPLPWKRPKC